MSEEEIAVFKATFPPIKSAILVSGDGTGGSIKLDIPQVERGIFPLLMDMCQDELIVTIQRARKRHGHGTAGSKRRSEGGGAG